MPLLDDLSKFAGETRWRAAQQLRILQLDNDIRELEGKIGRLKISVADAALMLSHQGKPMDPQMKQTCEQIDTLLQQISEIKVKQEAIRAEQPPISVDPIPSPVPGGRLVCPIGHGPVPDRYCQKCGKEGVPAS